MREPRCKACLADDRAAALMAALHLESRVGSPQAAYAHLLNLMTRVIDGAKEGDA